MTGKSTASSKKSPGKPWQPGQSGNPSGRRATPPEVKALFEAATPKVAAALIATALNRKHRDHVKAAIHVLERSLGKVPQPITGAEGGPITFASLAKLSDDELVERARAVLEKQAQPQLPGSTT